MTYRKVSEVPPHLRHEIVDDIKTLKLRHDMAQRRLGLALAAALDGGFTCRQLGEELGVAYTSVARWVREAREGKRGARA